MTPIGKLILTRIEQAGLIRVELITRLGYRNSSKGLRRLNQLIGTGEDRAGLLPKLSEILEIPREDVDQAIDQTHREIANEQAQADRTREVFSRANFVPYLQVETDRIFPSPIHVAVIGFQSLKRIPIPEDVSELPSEKRLEWIQLAVRENYRRTKGRLIAFGKITGYEYRVGFDRSIRFSTDGTLLGTNEVPSPTPIMSLKVRGRRLPT